MLILTFLSLGFAQMNDFYASIQGEDLCGRQFSEPRGMIKSIMHFGRKIGYKCKNYCLKRDLRNCLVDLSSRQTVFASRDF